MSIFEQQKQRIASIENSLKKAKAEFDKSKTKRKIILGSYLDKLEESNELEKMSLDGLIKHLENLKEKDKELFTNINFNKRQIQTDDNGNQQIF